MQNTVDKSKTINHVICSWWVSSRDVSQPLLAPLNELGHFSILARVMSAQPFAFCHVNG